MKMTDADIRTKIDDGFSRITTKDELCEYLAKIVEEDDGKRLSSQEVWARLDEHARQLKVKRRHNAGVSSKVYA